MKTIKDLKKGDYFKVKENGSVLVRGDYDRSTKKYSAYYFDDVCKERFFKPTQNVIVDFEF